MNFLQRIERGARELHQGENALVAHCLRRLLVGGKVQNIPLHLALVFVDNVGACAEKLDGGIVSVCTLICAVAQISKQTLTNFVNTAGADELAALAMCSNMRRVNSHVDKLLYVRLRGLSRAVELGMVFVEVIELGAFELAHDQVARGRVRRVVWSSLPAWAGASGYAHFRLKRVLTCWRHAARCALLLQRCEWCRRIF